MNNSSAPDASRSKQEEPDSVDHRPEVRRHLGIGSRIDDADALPDDLSAPPLRLTVGLAGADRIRHLQRLARRSPG
jgi:hypothetical protein